jgi:hypothetical protein
MHPLDAQANIYCRFNLGADLRLEGCKKRWKPGSKILRSYVWYRSKENHAEDPLPLDGTDSKKGPRGIASGKNWSEDQFARVQEGPGWKPAVLIMGSIPTAAPGDGLHAVWRGNLYQYMSVAVKNIYLGSQVEFRLIECCYS